MDIGEVLKWVSGLASVLLVHVYMAGVRAKATIHTRIDKLENRMEQRDGDWRAAIQKLTDKLDKHHEDEIERFRVLSERITHLEAVVQRNGH